MNVLLVTSYWPNLHYFFYVLNASIINIEQFDNYSKQSYRNRTQILSANGILNLSIPIKKNKSEKQPPKTSQELETTVNKNDKQNRIGQHGSHKSYQWG